MSILSEYVCDHIRPTIPWITGFLSVVCFCIALAQCLACAAAKPYAAEGAYTAALLDCVDQAKTLAASKACRAKVNADWSVDGGAK